MDDTGRLQVPQEMLDQLSIRGRALVDMEGDRIVIRPGASGISTVATSQAAPGPDDGSPESPADQTVVPARVELAQSVIPARRPAPAPPKPSRPAREPLKRDRPRDVPDEHRPFAPPSSGEARDD